MAGDLRCTVSDGRRHLDVLDGPDVAGIALPRRGGGVVEQVVGAEAGVVGDVGAGADAPSTIELGTADVENSHVGDGPRHKCDGGTPSVVNCQPDVRPGRRVIGDSQERVHGVPP